MTDELLDQVDKNDIVIGTVWKSEAHKNIKIIHREVAGVVFNNKGEVLLQQRSFDKKNDPGVWKITAAGHPVAGESPAIAISRELNEELGFDTEFIFFNKSYLEHNKVGENCEARFVWVYYSIINYYPKLVLQTSEVNDAKWVKLTDLEEFSKNNNFRFEDNSTKMLIEICKKLKML